MSATSATAAACHGSWMSVSTAKSGVADAFQNAQAFLEARSAIRIDARSVGFIERSLENEVSRDLANFMRQKMNVLLALDHARPGDQRERQAVANGDFVVDLGITISRRAKFPGALHRRGARLAGSFHPAFAMRQAAPIKDWNKGCGSSGFDLNSGWNWQPRYHG